MCNIVHAFKAQTCLDSVFLCGERTSKRCFVFIYLFLMFAFLYFYLLADHQFYFLVSQCFAMNLKSVC